MMQQPMMQQPMMQQPMSATGGGAGWMPQPTHGKAGVPSGLEYLSELDSHLKHTKQKQKGLKLK